MAKLFPASLVALVIPAFAFAQDLRPAWEAASLGLSESAWQALPPAGPSRERTLTEAVILLNRSPISDRQLDRADQLLAALSAGESSDVISDAALFYRGRILQVHRAVPDLKAACAIYERLWRLSPDSHWAQRGLVELAIGTLYGSASDPTGDDVLGLEKRGQRLTFPDARRDFHLVLADYYLAALQPAAPSSALSHLLAAEASGAVIPQQCGDLWIRIGRLSERVDNRAQALRFYELFVASYTRDNRLTLVKNRIAALRAVAP
jgi:hypothetical protein